MEEIAIGTRGCKPFKATHLFLTSLSSTPKTLLQLVRDRWSIENWHFFRNTQLHESAHGYQDNGACAMTTQKTGTQNLLRLTRFQLIRAGIQAVMHDITTLLAMALWQPRTKSD
ncbi:MULTISPECIES: hypothetical protein [unclassified Synechococcus]|uniref:hypothetical protein n=1 Tax=unclassified Synechococcus TaxID=2626047 RepID=UPI0000699324|nr:MULTISPECIES: hypothetical protein [unclassified Synechococcus]EAQ75950.1 hypothetical protein WH5701_14126 [Synechococcus sp. WH 5701]WFN58680.1 hypothetical protein N4320_12915 [Synechococcus sp. CCFWC 502]